MKTQKSLSGPCIRPSGCRCLRRAGGCSLCLRTAGGELLVVLRPRELESLAER